MLWYALNILLIFKMIFEEGDFEKYSEIPANISSSIFLQW